MAALGVPTTRALAAVTTGERVVRDEALPGAVLTRVAASHIRVGTFEFFAARDDRGALATLATYALARHYPDAVGTGNDALALLERVIDAQADLVARWLGVGFVHGVMNTDNTAISGETIDYGPCAFLDEYDPKQDVQLDRPRRALRVREPAAHRAVEPRAARRGSPPALSTSTRTRPFAWRPSASTASRALRRGARARLASEARARPGGGRRPGSPTTCSPDGGERRRLHALLPPPLRRRGRPLAGRRSRLALRRARRVPRLG